MAEVLVIDGCGGECCDDGREANLQIAAEGKKAAYDGKHVSENPYHFNTEHTQTLSWEYGFYVGIDEQGGGN